MQTIKKFQIGRKYYPSEKRILLQILERNGKELKVVHLRLSGTDTVFTATPLTADEKGAYEYFIYEGVRIPATNLLPIGRPVSTLPPERQKYIMDAIKRDIEHREAHGLDSADILTEHTRACPEPRVYAEHSRSKGMPTAKVTITHSVIKEKHNR